MNSTKITEEQWLGVERIEKPPIHLTAGLLSADFLNGRLLHIVYDNIPLVDEIYFALRDQNWGTVPFKVVSFCLERLEKSFCITFSAEHTWSNICYFWKCKIIGTSDSRIEYSIEGKSGSEFLRNRIGFCVLHSAAYAGKPCMIKHCDGSWEEGFFPVFIAPHQPFMDISSIVSFPDRSHRVRVDFAGDVFEMEDQRNWTDASYKTYCTPLERPFPVPVKHGEKIVQSTTVTFLTNDEEIPGKLLEAPGIAPEGDRLYKNKNDKSIRKASSESFSLGSRLVRPLNPDQLKRVKELQLGHICCEYHFARGEKFFDTILEQARDLGFGLRLVLFFTENWNEEAEAFLSRLRNLSVYPEAITLLCENGKIMEPEVIKQLRFLLRGTKAAIGSGTNGYFTQINRERPALNATDYISYANTPQVHAFDRESVFSTTIGQKANIESCKALYPELPVWISPLTMKIRWNPDATREEFTPPGACPDDVDPRQMSLFAASWFLRSVAACIEAGASGATCFELVGTRGIMEEERLTRDYGFPAFESMLFPLYFVFYGLRGMNACCIQTEITPDSVCLILADDKQKRIILANCREYPLTIARDRLPENVSGVVIEKNNIGRLALCDSGREAETYARKYDAADGALTLTEYALFLGDIKKI